MKDENGAFKNAMKLYIRFLQEDDSVKSDYIAETKEVDKSNFHTKLPFPTPEIIEKYNEKWIKLDKYPAQENILAELFNNDDNSNKKIVLRERLHKEVVSPFGFVISQND